MSKVAVVKTGGKQYIVKEQEFLVVDRLDLEKDAELSLDAVAIFDTEGDVQVGMPLLDTKVKAKIVEHVAGDKVRISRFKAKVRYRKVRGFRPQYTKVQILTI
jgi:large subunit ribosomal protein L21